MAEHKVLVTTSGLGGRLGKITNFTNKSLVRVGRRPALSYIIEAYSEDVEFVITLGHFGNLVRDFLEIAYPKRKFTFVEIDKYEGEGSSLLYSISKTENELQCPFIFHACDTITFDKIPDPDKNWVAGSAKRNSAQYRTLTIDDNHLRLINEKGETGYDLAYMGLAGICDYEDFWKHLREILKNNREYLSDCAVIQQMIKGSSSFDCLSFESWLDVGNIDQLASAREAVPDKFHLLDKLEESICFVGGGVIKFFHDKQIIIDRVERAKKLSPMVPEIKETKPNFYRYDYVEGDLYASSVNESNFVDFLEWSKRIWEPVEPDGDFYQQCNDFYFEKSKKRIDQFFQDTDIQDRERIINGVKCRSVKDLMESIPKDWICGGEPHRFHGDFILDNIIQTKDGFKLLDWRQNFAGSTNVGDVYYDLGKLNHNLTLNHDVIGRGLYDVSVGGEVECSIFVNSRLIHCREIFNSFLQREGYDSRKVDVITSIIWLNMAALHEHPLNMFLFYFGQYNLNRTLKEEKI